MKLALIGGALGILLLAATATATPAHSLKMFEARSAAESTALDFEIRHRLDSSTVGRCKRQAPRRIVCAAAATGENATATQTCTLQIRVRAVYRYSWEEIAAVVHRDCESEEKLRLSYEAALSAIQGEADKFAGRPTTITYLNRRDDLTFSGTAEWERPRVPPTEFDPIEKCSVDLVAALSESGISVSNDGFLCY